MNINLINDLKKARIPLNIRYSNIKNFNLNNNIFNNRDVLNKLNFNIIVARYNENIDWLNKFSELLIVYDKGEKYNLYSLRLPNLGREGNTYLYHIINNWNNLSTINFFTQGNIYDHNIFPLEYYLFSNKHLMINLSCHKTNFDHFWGHLKISDSRYRKVSKCNLNYGQWWDKYIKKKKPQINDFKWSPGGIFSVSKELIKKNSKEYYQELLTSLSTGINPEEGHYLERSWYYIFDEGIISI